MFYCHPDLGRETGLNFPYSFTTAKTPLDPLSKWKGILVQKVDILPFLFVVLLGFFSVCLVCLGFFVFCFVLLFFSFCDNILKGIYFCSHAKQKTFGKYSPHFVVVTLKVLTKWNCCCLVNCNLQEFRNYTRQLHIPVSVSCTSCFRFQQHVFYSVIKTRMDWMGRESFVQNSKCLVTHWIEKLVQKISPVRNRPVLISSFLVKPKDSEHTVNIPSFTLMKKSFVTKKPLWSCVLSESFIVWALYSLNLLFFFF